MDQHKTPGDRRASTPSHCVGNHLAQIMLQLPSKPSSGVLGHAENFFTSDLLLGGGLEADGAFPERSTPSSTPDSEGEVGRAGRLEQTTEVGLSIASATISGACAVIGALAAPRALPRGALPL